MKTPQPEDLPRRITALQDELRDVKKQLDAQTSESVAEVAEDLFAKAEEVGGVKIIARATDVTNRETLREFIDRLRGKGRSVAILLGSATDGKVALTAAVSKDLVQRGISASDCVRAAAKIVGGGGGGRPDLAEAGGKHPEKLGRRDCRGGEVLSAQARRLNAPRVSIASRTDWRISRLAAQTELLAGLGWSGLRSGKSSVSMRLPDLSKCSSRLIRQNSPFGRRHAWQQ